MLKRRSTWLGGTGGLLLVLSLSGVVAGATMLTAVAEPAPEVVEPGDPADTTATFEDLNGDGIDDDCQEDEVADADAAEAAETAADTDGDGVISTTEAAHSDRIGGENCNHGGYVSWIAGADEAVTDAEAVKQDKEAARAVRAARKAEQALARDAAKAEHALARETKRSERAAAHDARKAERQAAKAAKQAERQAAKAARPKKGH